MTRAILILTSATALAMGCSEFETPHTTPPSPRESIGGAPTSAHVRARPDTLPIHDPATLEQTYAVGEEDVQLVGDLAIVSDPTTRSVYIADIATGDLHHTLAFEGRPARIATSERVAYVVLQEEGAIATIDIDRGVTLTSASVCPAPRGIAADPARQRVWVACASGEVVGLEPTTLETRSTWHIDADLRDIVVTPNHLHVSRFRSAEILTLRPEDGQLLTRTRPLPTRPDSEPNTMWRLVPGERQDTLITSYQESLTRPLSLLPDKLRAPSADGYLVSGACSSSPVASLAATLNVRPNGEIQRVRGTCQPGAVPVDVDEGPCGPVALAAAPTRLGADGVRHHGACQVLLPTRETRLASAYHATRDQIVLVSRANTLSLHVQSNQRAERTHTITLHTGAPEALGHRLFHTDTGSGLACASCHPSGGDDGHVWAFERLGRERSPAFARRTQNLRGGIEGKLHWDGEFENINALMTDVFSSRMGGFQVEQQDADAIATWLRALPPDSGMTLATTQESAIAHGAQLYADAGCTDCHGGEKHTDYKLYDVGTGGTFKTPTLRGISQRHKFMHDGCALTLRDRFEPGCGGDAHGDLAGMTDADLDDLTTYLKTL